MDKAKSNITVKFILEDGVMLKEQTFGMFNLASTVKMKATDTDKDDHPEEWASYQTSTGSASNAA